LASLKRLGVGLVVDEHPAPARPHQAGIAQDPQVLRDGTLRDAEPHGQRPDTERAAGDQAKDAQAHLDGQGAQQAGNIGKVFHGLDYFSVR
jgi:hypothetical protein